jgi:MFS family permease
MTERNDPYVSLRNRDFRWYLVSLVAMTLATQTQATVVGWQVYALTRDPLMLGFIGLAEALPFIGLALYAGHVADRRNRLRLAVASLLMQAACAGGLLAMTLADGFLRPDRVWPLFAVIGLSGVARSFLQPARQALGAEIVPRETYANAIAWRSSTWQLAAVVGPALGGMLYGVSGAAAAYLAEALLSLAAVAALARVAYAPAPREPAEAEGWRGLTVGIRFLRTQPVLLGALTLDLFSVLFGGAVALLPIFAGEILKTGPIGLGVLRAAPAVGAVIMSLVLAYFPLRRAGPRLLWAVAGFGACMIGFALSRSFALSAAFLLLSGAFDNVSVVIRSTLLTILTPQHLLGRVSAVNQVFIGSSNEIGSFESGVAARLLGTVASVVAGGCVTLAIVAATAWKVPALRRMDRLA